MTAHKGERRSFLGVYFLVPSHGQDTMKTKMFYKKKDHVPFQKHPNEQSGYMISGKYRIRFGNYDQIIGQGDAYSIPKNVEHKIEIMEPGEVLDFFCPPRGDYL